MTSVADQNLLSPEMIADPLEYYRALRRDDPVHWAEKQKAWILTRYPDVVAGYSNPALSSDRVRPLMNRNATKAQAVDANTTAILEILSSWMVVTDPPAHSRLRKLANHAFRQQRVAAMADWIAELVGELLDEFIESGKRDFVAGFAYPLPATVIARMMGAPKQDRDLFQRWSDELALVAFGAGGDARSQRHERALAGVQEMQAYISELIAQRRSEPGEDMISALLEGTTREGDHLSDSELTAMCALVLFAGHETTTNLLCNALVTLSRFPDQRTLLENNPEMINGAVEEVLRFEGPIKILTRWVADDVEIGGQTISSGERVLLINQSANRDPEVFEHADTFDITRPTQPLHVGFGRGAHACLGAQLARVEGRVALPMIIERLRDFHVDPNVQWKPILAARAVQSLEIDYTS